ncbi:hypothetical protein DRN86_01270 [Candidatus Geothermarchaeota archaeon]|nr:MAG: hypothetical protein DRN86_01270 [Candidatus Geothermarchaeota archaeon]
MEIKFIADEMNGNLAKWLRILGYDCLYPKGGDNLDEKILRTAEKEKRIVLTADRELFRTCVKRGIKAVYTPFVQIEEKLAYLIRKLNLSVDFSLAPRCTICNHKLRYVHSDELKGKLDEGIIRRYKKFWVCDNCGKIYWEGSHWINIKRTIESSLKLSKKVISEKDENHL